MQKNKSQILKPQNEKMQNKAFFWSHCQSLSGHFGANASCARVAERFYFPAMAAFIKRKVKACNICLAKQQKVDLKSCEHKPRRHGYPGQCVYLDLVGLMLESETGKKFIVTMQDRCSKYVVATIKNLQRAPSSG